MILGGPNFSIGSVRKMNIFSFLYVFKSKHVSTSHTEIIRQQIFR